MKEFEVISFDPDACRQSLDKLSELLSANDSLSERKDILPFFRDHRQLAAFLGTSFATVGPADRLAYEFELFGDFRPDILIGNFENKRFCAIELEEARPNSIFECGSRTIPQWGRRLEQGFGQLVDWFYALDDHRGTEAFSRRFGYGHIEFYGMLIVGRRTGLSDSDVNRLRWRSDRITINNHRIYCRSYDDLLEDLDKSWRLMSLFTQSKMTHRT